MACSTCGKKTNKSGSKTTKVVKSKVQTAVYYNGIKLSKTNR